MISEEQIKIPGKIIIKTEDKPSSNEPPSPNEPSKPEEFGTILPAQSNVTETEKIKTDVGGNPIPYQHIIIFNEAYTENAKMLDTTLQALSLIVESLGGEVIFTYNNTISGFTFKTTDQSKSDQILNILRLDPRVKFAEQDRIVVPFSEVIPSGIQRVGLDKVINGSGIDSSSIDVDIAIIDSGIDLDHSDLNVFKNTTTIIPQILSSEDNTIRAKDINLQKIGLNVENNTTSFYPPFSQESISTGDDNCGHGTHVAGIAAAKDNSFGVVGIAPGAKLWAIKVLDYDKNSGKCFGSISSVIAAIDYVTKYSDQIDVANLSLGCKCNSTALDDAITRSVAKNVTYVTASGNINTDASSFSPANHKDVLTVSAIADIDGKCGSLGTPIWVDAGNFSGFSNDDAFASFSNYGSVVDIAAPGVKINSTYINGTYALMGGTSIASPHVTGMVALYKSMNPMASPIEIKEILTNAGSYPNTVCDGLSYGYFDRDSDDDHEPLLHVFDIKHVK
jgi:subtilisin family serine protease